MVENEKQLPVLPSVYTDERELWKIHDNYKPDGSLNRIVTRSQTAFKRIKKSESDLKLLINRACHRPPNKPHLMVALKGVHGGIPRTTITRSTGKYISKTKKLGEELKEYKEFVKMDERLKKRRKESIENPEYIKFEDMPKDKSKDIELEDIELEDTTVTSDEIFLEDEKTKPKIALAEPKQEEGRLGSNLPFLGM